MVWLYTVQQMRSTVFEKKMEAAFKLAHWTQNANACRQAQYSLLCARHTYTLFSEYDNHVLCRCILHVKCTSTVTQMHTCRWFELLILQLQHSDELIAITNHVIPNIWLRVASAKSHMWHMLTDVLQTKVWRNRVMHAEESTWFKAACRGDIMTGACVPRGEDIHSDKEHSTSAY